MIYRLLEVPTKKSYFLFGPRQTGKSTFLKKKYQNNIFYVNLLLNESFIKYNKEPQIFRLEAVAKIENENIKTIIVDEVQRIPQLLNEIHYLIETYDCQFILSGSSARKLKRGGANLLAGRALQRYLFPFTYFEIKSTFNLEDALQFGTLPPVYTSNTNEKIEILKTYTETYLKEEIQMEGLTRNLGGFSRFLDIAASQFGELVSFSSIARECHISSKSTQSYYEILEDTLIGYRLQPWIKSARKRLVAHPKFYFFDCGVTNSINQHLTSKADNYLKGRLFEQFIIIETYRQLKYSQNEINMYFWKTNHGAEVDLILEKNESILGAFEIKLSSTITGAHLSGLRSFKEEHPNTDLYVICQATNPYKIDTVSILPWQHYLEKLIKIIKEA